MAGATRSRLKHTTYNRYCGFLKQLFEIAVADRIVADSPFAGVKTKLKRPQKPIRTVTTQAQFENIVADIRSQRFSAEANHTADFTEFLGLAGLGQAEAGALTWGTWIGDESDLRSDAIKHRLSFPSRGGRFVSLASAA